MTAPFSSEEDPDVSATDALRDANDALAQAEIIRDRGAHIARGWRRSRQDNNFRFMIRDLIPRAE